MADAKCPICGSKRFYVKNPDDEYDLYEFECRDGEIYFEDTLTDEECPEVRDGTETYCNNCAWHDKFEELK
ncbi:MAG: hypothetical protein P8165_16785 [Deltaproteobacteria bacterium]